MNNKKENLNESQHIQLYFHTASKELINEN